MLPVRSEGQVYALAVNSPQARVITPPATCGVNSLGKTFYHGTDSLTQLFLI